METYMKHVFFILEKVKHTGTTWLVGWTVPEPDTALCGELCVCNSPKQGGANHKSVK